jgi:phospholipid N-methyltransferase
VSINLYSKIKSKIFEEGLVIDSSSFLVKEMVQRIDFSQDLHILEIGSGKGVFTKQIAEKMSSNSQLDVCEIKPEFNPYIEKIAAANIHKKISVYNDCVTELWESPIQYDAILSSLPLENFDRKADNNAFLFKVIQGFESNLKVGGLYLQYQYFCSNKSNIENIFGKKMNNISFVALNVLPAFVYSMTK